MELIMTIHNVKSIKDFQMIFPLDKGLYAITGENASGKSTLVACASTVFYTMPMIDYFGRPSGDAFIKFTLDGASRGWNYHAGSWIQASSPNKMSIKGFYEGSVGFGNRFKDTSFSVIKKLDETFIKDLDIADDFIKSKLGFILHNDSNYYNQLFKLKIRAAKEKGLIGEHFFNRIDDRYISQLRMSTGENLLISVLNSLSKVCQKRAKQKTVPCVVFLDEIELALHPSALRRLLISLHEISNDFNLSIYFSTHSIDLIRGISPKNIFYLQRDANDEINIETPCYPAFATKNLYDDDGYGVDAVILVEDNLARQIVNRLLFEKSLINNMHVKVTPVGGWTNVIAFAHDAFTSKLLLKDTRILMVLDKDIEAQVPPFLKKHKQYTHLHPDFLPISSLEKYLKKNLIDKLNPTFYSLMDSYVFQGKPLNTVIRKYKATADCEADADGKTFKNMLTDELRHIGKDELALVDAVVKYLMTYEIESVDTLTSYLREKLNTSSEVFNDTK